MDWLSPIRELFGFALPFLERLPVIRAILGFAVVFFLPGFAWTLVFFGQLGVLERVVLSFGLSIVVVTLSLLVVSRLIAINGFNAALLIIVVTILPVAVIYLSRFIRRKRQRVT